jgi:hypothetical protein
MNILAERSDEFLGAQYEDNFAVRKEVKFTNACLFGPPRSNAGFERIDIQQECDERGEGVGDAGCPILEGSTAPKI